MRTFDYQNEISSRLWDHEIVTAVSKIHEMNEKLNILLNEKSASNQGYLKLIKMDPWNQLLQRINGESVSISTMISINQELIKNVDLHNNIMLAELNISSLQEEYLEPYESLIAAEQAFQSMRTAVEEEQYEVLLVIPSFLLDLVHIHLFHENNSVIPALFAGMLLEKYGFPVHSASHFMHHFLETKEQFKAAVIVSGYHWKKGENDNISIIKYMLHLLETCYREALSQLTMKDIYCKRKNSYDIVQEAVIHFTEPFTKQDILQRCPQIKSSSVEAALKRLVEEGVLYRIGTGRSTKYQRGHVPFH